MQVKSPFTTMHINLWMQQKRSRDNQSKDQAAELLGIPLRTYEKYEHGILEPGGTRMIKILAWLDLLKAKSNG